MGQYFKIVNPTKKQYLDPGHFDENNKASGYMLGVHAAAVAVLVCKPLDVPAHDRYGSLEGTWFGDALYAAGDDNGEPNPECMVTVTPEAPDRNLNQMAEQEFEDISYRAIAMLCEGRDYYADLFAMRVAGMWGDALLVHLGNVVFQLGCDPLRKALERVLGVDWPDRYKAAHQNRPWLDR
jgi:hypothetical protein